MKTAAEIAQWVINNRYPKGENDKVTDSEMYHQLVEWLDDHPTPKVSAEEAKELAKLKIGEAEEMWDSLSQVIDTDIDTLQYYAGMAVVLKEDFIKFMSGLLAGYAASQLRTPAPEGEKVKEIIQNALYATGQMSTFDCEEVCNGILLYLKDHNFKIVSHTPANSEGKYEWVRVEDGLPEVKYEYLLRCFAEEEEFFEVGYFDGTKFFTAYGRNGEDLNMNDITHWQPLPTPPKQ